MPTFVVTGTATRLGALVVEALGHEGPVASFGPQGWSGAGSGEAPALDAACLVSLAIGPCPSPEVGGATTRLAGLRRALAAADDAGVRRVVHLSSAVVYGAAADNAVPLTEDAPVRPEAAFAWAIELAEAERLVAEWRDGGAGRTAAVLRPALVVAPDDDGFLARALGGLSGPRTVGESRPVQVVHLDDVVAAVVLCATAATPVDGPLNVAPDGWVDDAEVPALAGGLLPSPSLPARLVGPARRLGWVLGVGATPPQAEAYARHPWVVAADRLRALGWEATHTTEEAIVATTTCSPLASISPARRQQLLLATTATVLAGTLLAIVAVLTRALRPRR